MGKKRVMRADGGKQGLQQRISRRHFLLLSGATGVSLALGRKGWGQAQRAAPVRLNVSDGRFLSGGATFIALERGYFQKMGIELNLRYYIDGALAVAPLTSGELDIGHNPTTAVLFNAVAKGAPIRAFIDRGQEKPGREYAVTCVSKALWDAGLRSFQDLGKLKGKKVTVITEGTLNHYLLSRKLERVGLNPRTDVEWVFGLSMADALKMLERGIVDATDFAYDFAYTAEQAGYARMISPTGDIEPSAQIAVVVARREFLREKRETAVRYAMAYLQGARDFNAAASDPAKHPEAVAALNKHTFLKDPKKLSAIAPHWAWLAEDGIPNVPSILRAQDYFVKPMKLVERPVKEEDLFELGIVREAAKRLDAERPFGR